MFEMKTIQHERLNRQYECYYEKEFTTSSKNPDWTEARQPISEVRLGIKMCLNRISNFTTIFNSTRSITNKPPRHHMPEGDDGQSGIVERDERQLGPMIVSHAPVPAKPSLWSVVL